MEKVVLYGHPHSSCTWRVRIALTLKDIDFEEVSLSGSSTPPIAFAKANPLMQVPTLIVGESTFIQSIAIIEYLDEIKPEPPLLPKDPVIRSKARALAETVTSAIQPFQNSSGALINMMAGKDNFNKWAHYWIHKGFVAIEEILKSTSGKYSVGDVVTVADLCLVPQYHNAVHSYKIDKSFYPGISKVVGNCLKLEAFSATGPV